MHKLSFRKVLLSARTEYVRWLVNPRMIIIAVMLVFVYNFAIAPLQSAAEEMGVKLNALEPFIAVANSGMIMMIVPLVFLTLVSDFPKTDNNTFLSISRTGRINWVLSQILLMIMMIITYLALIFVVSVLPCIGNCFWGNEWSDTATKYTTVFPDRAGDFVSELLPENLYNQLTIFHAAAESYLLIALYLFLLGMILLTACLFKIKVIGMVIAGGIVSIGAGLCSVYSEAMWLFPMANSIIWVHYTRYFSIPVKTMAFSYSYLCIGAVGLMIVSVLKVRNYSYDTTLTIDN